MKKKIFINKNIFLIEDNRFNHQTFNSSFVQSDRKFVGQIEKLKKIT
jgi:hypothetical protein